MASKTDIFNMALAHIGVGKDISNADSDKDLDARTGRLYYSTALEMVLRDFPWPFATKIQALNLVEENPNNEWKYSYTYPPDCKWARRILSGIRTDNRQSRVSYRIVQGTTGLLIYTDWQDACLEYTVLETNTERFPSDFVTALSYRLAAFMAPRLSKGDPEKLQRDVLALYQFEISKAQANAANEEQPDEEPDAESIRAREGDTIIR